MKKQLGFLVDELIKCSLIERKIVLLDQWNRDGAASGDVDHGFISRKTWIGVDHFISGFDQSQGGKKEIGICPWTDYYSGWIDLDPPPVSRIRRDGSP